MSDALAEGLGTQFPNRFSTHVSVSDAAFGLRTALSNPWGGHVIWTRQYIVAAVAGTPMRRRRLAGSCGTRRTSATPSFPPTARPPGRS